MNPLQDLKDISIPEEIANWPPAYGWWLLAGIVFVSIIIVARWCVKSWKIRELKRQGLLALRKIDINSADATSQCNQILKRVAICYFPHQQPQNMFGEQWTNFLLTTIPTKKATQLSKSFEAMQASLYQPTLTDCADHQDYQQTCETWMKLALPPRQRTLKSLELNNA